MNEIQKELYRLFVKSEIVQKVLHERNNVDPHIVLQLVCFLRKIVNHPRLIYNYVVKNSAGIDDDTESGDEVFEKNPDQIRKEQLMMGKDPDA